MAEKGFKRKLAAVISSNTKRYLHPLYCQCKNAFRKRLLKQTINSERLIGFSWLQIVVIATKRKWR
jgi:hypothetical protein